MGLCVVILIAENLYTYRNNKLKRGGGDSGEVESNGTTSPERRETVLSTLE